MARIKSIKPPCGYSTDGISQIFLLDFEDFDALRFDNGQNYDICRISDILRRGAFIEVSAPSGAAKYQGEGQYQHTLETFVPGLNADNISNLTIATKRRFLVVFVTNAQTVHVFGQDAGATLAYETQTAEGLGAFINISANSIHPIFEASREVLYKGEVKYLYAPDFNLYSYCTTDEHRI